MWCLSGVEKGDEQRLGAEGRPQAVVEGLASGSEVLVEHLKLPPQGVRVVGGARRSEEDRREHVAGLVAAVRLALHPVQVLRQVLLDEVVDLPLVVVVPPVVLAPQVGAGDRRVRAVERRPHVHAAPAVGPHGAILIRGRPGNDQPGVEAALAVVVPLVVVCGPGDEAWVSERHCTSASADATSERASSRLTVRTSMIAGDGSLPARRCRSARPASERSDSARYRSTLLSASISLGSSFSSSRIAWAARRSSSGGVEAMGVVRNAGGWVSLHARRTARSVRSMMTCGSLSSFQYGQ